MGQEAAFNTYFGIFLALMIGGETVLLPALFLAVSGALHLPLIFILSISATMLADMIFYFLGTTISRSDLSKHHFLSKYKKRIDTLAHVFELRALPILFTSKFVYGTRTAVQILCGTYHIPFTKYFLVNALGITILNLIYVLAAKGVYRGVTQINTSTPALILSFVLFASIAVGLQLLFKKYIWKKWYP